MTKLRVMCLMGVCVLTSLSGCRTCKNDRCSLLGRSRSNDTNTSLTNQGDCPPGGTSGVYYGDAIPMTTSMPNMNTNVAPRPDNELPMPGSNIQPPLNPIPTTIGYPVNGRVGK